MVQNSILVPLLQTTPVNGLSETKIEDQKMYFVSATPAIPQSLAVTDGFCSGFVHYKAKTVAEQLTLLEYNVFCKVCVVVC